MPLSPAPPDAAADSLLGRRVAGISIAASCVLAALNVSVGLVAGSTSVFAAGVEFLGDVVASTFVLIGLTLAARPADENHPYGHGRIEILAGLTVGAILGLGGVGICYRSLQRVNEIHPPPGAYAVVPLVIAIGVRGVMSAVKFRVGRRIGSAALTADAWNDAVDILSAVAALAALVLTLNDPARFLAADHYGGFAVGMFVVYTGLRVARDSAMDLIDTMPEAAVIDSIRQAALEVEGVAGVEKLFARKTGLRHHVEIHVEVDPQMTVAESHCIATEVRRHIRETRASVADVLVHIEPTGME
ncbi:MAG: cation transporter [Acidobacteria bacterium]|nr:cation transporter [Acidobacteriota bacterium]